MRILFIEDEPGSIEPAIDRCKEGLENPGVDVCSFEDAEAMLRTYRPNIVILDLLRGSPSEGDIAGNTTYSFIWDNQFCPIVVYSAEPDWLDDEDHPFVKKVRKGSGSEETVLEAVQEFVPHVQALQRTESEVRQRSLRSIARSSAAGISHFRQRYTTRRSHHTVRAADESLP